MSCEKLFFDIYPLGQSNHACRYAWCRNRTAGDKVTSVLWGSKVASGGSQQTFLNLYNSAAHRSIFEYNTSKCPPQHALKHLGIEKINIAREKRDKEKNGERKKKKKQRQKRKRYNTHQESNHRLQFWPSHGQKGISKRQCWIRPYYLESTASRPISEVKRGQASLVLRWGTTWEPLVLYSFPNTSPFFPGPFQRTALAFKGPQGPPKGLGREPKAR